MKKIIGAMLAFVLCGTMGIAAIGCGKNKGDGATSAQKEKTYNALEQSLETMLTSGKTYKLSIDFDQSNSMTRGSAKQEQKTDFVSAIYVKAESSSTVQMDMTLEGFIETEYGFAAGYVRNELFYGGSTDGSATAVTEAEKAAIEYRKWNWQEELGDLSDADISSSETSLPAEQQKTVELIEKAAKNVLMGITATVSKGEEVTVTVDMKAELNALYTVAKSIVDSLTPTTTVKEVLENEELKKTFNRYMGTLSAIEMHDLMAGLDLQGLPALSGIESGYDYLVAYLLKATGSAETPIGAEDVRLLQNTMTEVSIVLNGIQEAKYSWSMKNSMLSGMECKFVMSHAEDGATVDVNFALTIDVEEVNGYKFVDVSKLKLSPYDGCCDDCGETAYYAEDGEEYCTSCYLKHTLIDLNTSADADTSTVLSEMPSFSVEENSYGVDITEKDNQLQGETNLETEIMGSDSSSTYEESWDVIWSANGEEGIEPHC